MRRVRAAIIVAGGISRGRIRRRYTKVGVIGLDDACGKARIIGVHGKRGARRAAGHRVLVIAERPFVYAGDSVTQTVAILDKSPTASRVVLGPPSILRKGLPGVVSESVGVSPFVACFVSAATYDGADTVSAAEAMFHSLGGGHVIHNVGVHAPCVMVGDLFETVGVALAHIVAGDRKSGG